MYCQPTLSSASQYESKKSSNNNNNNNDTMTLSPIPLTQEMKQRHMNDEEKHEEKQDAAVEWTLTTTSHKKTTIIGKWELAHCPCCRPTEQAIRATTSLMDQCNVDDGDDNESVEEEDEEELLGLPHAANVDESYGLIPGQLENGVAYTPTQILVQGWLHKKGTGTDWLKSRAWKARWGRLVWAKVEGYGAIELPLLLMYWYPSSKSASTAFVLSRSTVVVAVDYAADPTAWNANRFEIRHVEGVDQDEDEKTNTTRTFSAANRSERDAWVYAMAQALLDYAKSKKVHDNAVQGRLRPISPPPTRETTRFVPRATSPPPPRSPVPKNLPKSPRSVPMVDAS